MSKLYSQIKKERAQVEAVEAVKVERKYSSPIHKPCPTMAGMENPTPERRQNSIQAIEKLRAKFGLKKSVKRKVSAYAMNYRCVGGECIQL